MICECRFGGRPLSPNSANYLDFDFDLPPSPFVKIDRRTTLLTEAQKSYDGGDYHSAVSLLAPIITTDPLARPLLLQTLSRLGDKMGIIELLDPPESAAEAIALMDALWVEDHKQRLSEVLKLQVITESEDGSVVEMREKFVARLKI